tara:strand:+ start:30099 stop:31091 length:993 start_codon:yes stop_codon:yes gene_type:complete
MKNKIKLVLWGLGRHANKRILPAIEKSKSVQLYGICTRNELNGKAESNRRSCKYYASSKIMLSDSHIDAVYICTPSGLHFYQGKLVLESGKHLWLEKPLTTSYKHTMSLIKIAKENQLFIGEAFMYLYDNQFVKMKNIVNNGELGKLEKLICRFSIPKLNNPGFRIFPSLGASALMDVGSYTFSLASQLFNGNYEIELADYSVNDKEIDQSGFCVITYDNGEKAILDWSYNSCFINQAELWFDNGALIADRIFSKSGNNPSKLYLRLPNGDLKEERLIIDNSYVNMLEDFAYCTKFARGNNIDKVISTSLMISEFIKKTKLLIKTASHSE